MPNGLLRTSLLFLFDARGDGNTNHFTIGQLAQRLGWVRKV